MPELTDAEKTIVEILRAGNKGVTDGSSLFTQDEIALLIVQRVRQSPASVQQIGDFVRRCAGMYAGGILIGLVLKGVLGIAAPGFGKDFQFYIKEEGQDVQPTG